MWKRVLDIPIKWDYTIHWTAIMAVHNKVFKCHNKVDTLS